MKKLFYTITPIIFFAPFLVLAATTCSSDGYTVETINGVFGNENDAENNSKALQYISPKFYNGEKVIYQYLLNPTHLGGLGDLAMAAYQKYFEKETVSDYDLIEMLRSASEKITTKKVLLVAHSQGNFYANSFYDIVVGAVRPDRGVWAGVSKESIGVYAVATPASRVAGGGEWLTSDTDKVIAGLVGHLPGRSIMPPNTSIKLGAGDDRLGHNFSDVYLKYRGAEIVAGIERSLDKLKVPAAGAADESGPCIAQQPSTLAHSVEGASLAVADPVASIGSKVVVGAVGGTYLVGATLANTAAAMAGQAATLASVASAGLSSLSGSIAGGANQITPSQMSQVAVSPTIAPSATAVISHPAIPVTDFIPASSSPALAVAVAPSSDPQAIASTSSTPIIQPAATSSPVVDNVPAAIKEIADDRYEAVPLVYVATPIPESHPIPSGGPTPADAASDELAVATPTDSSSEIVSDVSALISSSTPTLQSGQATTTDISSEATSTPVSEEPADFTEAAPTLQSEQTTTTETVATEATSTTAESTTTEPITPPPPPPPPDTTPPSVSLSVLECRHSLSPSGCMTLSNRLNISWSSLDSDLDHYVINLNGAITATTSTSTIVTAVNDSSYQIYVSAVDLAGNQSNQVGQTIYVSQTPVVINELAWGGTSAHPDDEWIELYNRSPQDVDLSGWTLYSKTDMSPYIYLSGVIQARGYFLIEAKNTGETDEATQGSVKDIAADLWTSFGSRLNDLGENVALSYGSTTVDEIPYCYKWCGVPASRTTERFDPDSPGNNSSNWSANTAVIINGQDANGGAILGTPRQRNSLNYLVNRGSNISSDLTLKKANSPYLIDGIAQRVNRGAALTIEPGVVIKFKGPAWLMADGNIVANGTASDPIVFTAFTDDDYGGDTDKASVTPAKGSWFGVELSGLSTASSFVNDIFRYGGNYGQGSYKKAMLYAGQVSPPISNSVFEYSKAYGLYLDGSSSVVTNNVFRNNVGDSLSSGIYASQGAPSIVGNSFSKNGIGAYIVSPASKFSDNVFSDNGTAVFAVGPLGVLSGNSGSAGDMISLYGNLSAAGATTTLVGNPMPYFLSGMVIVPAGSALDIKEGTVIKNSINGPASLLNVFGKLNIDTSTTTGVVFSSVMSTSTRSGWMGILLNSGSSSKIKGATIQNAVTGLNYVNSPVSLEDVNLSTNTTALQADYRSPVLNHSNVIFTNNGANKNPSNLW